MDQTAIVIDSYEELKARTAYAPSLAFHPKGDRRFGAVIAPYRFTDAIACGIDSCHTKHLKGYLITTSDGQETGIGSHCGRKHFGIHFTRERKRVDEAVQRKRRIDTVMRAVAQIPAYLAIVKELKTDYAELTEIKRRFIDLAGWGLFNELKERANKGYAQIIKFQPMTQSEAEAHFATNNRKKRDRQDWPEKEVLVATLDGLEFVRSKFTDMLATNLIQPLERFAQTKPADVERMKPRTLYNEAKWIGKVPTDITKARAVIQSGRDFFAVENLLKLSHLEANIPSMAPLLRDLREAELKLVTQRQLIPA